MNKQSRKHQHSPSHAHEHAHGKHKAGWKPHRDWRVWAAVLMLVAMAVYVLTLDESIWPGGGGPEIPAAPAPAGAP